MVQESWHIQYSIALWSFRGTNLKAASKHFLHIISKVCMNGVILARKHLCVEPFHSLCSERGHLHDHFIEDTASAPDVTSVIIGHVFPDLRAGIIRGSGLCSHHSAFGDSGDVHVSKLDDALLGEEHIRAFDVSMADTKIVERLQTSDDLNKKVPTLLFCEVRISFLVIVNKHQKVATVCIFHDEA